MPESHSTFELILSAHGESRALVVRDGQTLTVSETCRAWDNMNKVVTSTVQLDDDGLPRLVTSADGRVTYQRVVKLPKDLEAKATKALVSEIGSVIKRENKAEPTAGIVVVHGQGPELFPPDIYVVPSRLLPTVKDDTWLEPNRLETAGLEPTYLLSDPAPPWLANVNLRLNDEDVVARLLTAMKEATRQLATTKWPLKTPPSFVWLHDIEDGTWTPFHEGSGKL